MTKFSKSIDLVASWPIRANNKKEMDISGLLVWARTYFDAAEQLHFSELNRRRSSFYSGPVIQSVGLATELTLKVLLRGSGKSSGELRRYSHNTYEAYCDARDCFDETEFIKLHISNTMHMQVPEEVRARLSSQGEKDVDTRWRMYFDHLRILDGVYDRPYRSRYVSPGAIVLPDAEIVLIGTKILLSAMEERL